MQDVRTLIKYHRLLKPFLLIFAIAIFFDIGMTMLGLINPLFTRVLFDYAYPYRNLTLLNVSVIAIVVSYFILFFLSVASDYLQIFIAQQVTAKLTSRVYHAIQCLPLRFHQEKRSGDLIIRITDDVETTIAMITAVLPTIFIEGGKFVIILIIALAINPPLTLLALLSIPLYVLETKFYAKRLQGVEAETIDIGSQIYTHAQERLANIKTIKAFGQEQNETLSFGKLIKRSYQIGVKGRLLDVISAFTNSITLQMWSLFLAWYLGLQVVRGHLSIGEIIALMLYLEQLGSPIQSFVALVTNWKTSLVSMHRLSEVLDTPSESDEDHAKRADLAITGGGIEASQLSFAYSEQEPVLHDIQVSFPPRSLTAIVGGSGSGKSTLVNLLLRFFDPSKGAIFIDGQNISEIRITSLRHHVGMIAQDFSLFDGTIMDNILYGNEDKSFDEMVKATRLASAHDFITKFPDGFDEQVGTAGELLSEGQRQRIAIARTLLRDPEILIFDEATSALDPESEFKVQEVMSKLTRSKTVIAIAHRLSTIKAADKILVLEDGRFVEEGRFDELIEKKGAFYRFYWRQFGGLANLRQQLGAEFERAIRYGSCFSLSMLKVKTFELLLEQEGADAAHELIQEVEYLLKKNIRLGDNCAVLDDDLVFVLLPEVTEDQIGGFYKRTMTLIEKGAYLDGSVHVMHKDLLFVATRIAERAFKTPEELMAALKAWVDAHPHREGVHIVDPMELRKKHGNIS